MQRLAVIFNVVNRMTGMDLLPVIRLEPHKNHDQGKKTSLNETNSSDKDLLGIYMETLEF